eukprot:187054_1
MKTQQFYPTYDPFPKVTITNSPLKTPEKKKKKDGEKDMESIVLSSPILKEFDEELNEQYLSMPSQTIEDDQNVKLKDKENELKWFKIDNSVFVEWCPPHKMEDKFMKWHKGEVDMNKQYEDLIYLEKDYLNLIKLINKQKD